MKDKHIIVVSIDAMVGEDLAYASTLTNFSRIMKNASCVERVRTIYPSLTHPAHASIMTGCTPAKTGIISNMIFDPENPLRSPAPWYNKLSDIKCDTLLHAAKRSGLTTAAACWPLTCCGTEAVDYLVPGLLNIDFEGYEDDPIAVYRKNGASPEVIDIIEEAVKRFGYRDVHPAIEELQAYCSAEIIRRFKPNLLLTHPSYVDNRRHAVGVYGSEVEHALRETDRWLGMLLDAVCDAGIENETDFVLLSDHGQINITRIISPNVFLRDAGYIKADECGNLVSYDAFVKGVGASAQVYLSRRDDKELYDGVYALLSKMADEGIYGFERVYTHDECERMFGLSGDFSFVLEGDGYTGFGDYISRPAIRGHDPGDYRFGKGTHGHLPTKGPQPIFMVSGPSFKDGVVIPEGSILNDAPTIAAALGIELPCAEGVAIKEFLR